MSAPADAAPDPYSPSVQTSCRIDVPAVVQPDKKFTIKVSVRANSATEPRGLIHLWITSAGQGTVWEKTVPYNGGTKKVQGPALTAGDDYEIRARFQPRDAEFAQCRGSVSFDVKSQGDQRDPDGNGNGDGDGDGDGDDQGGILPDTGGPALLWLLLGLGLVGGGTAAVVYSRRRSAAAAAAVV
ncbi:LPXTG cell wall anchor domain-containing protein [Nocardioides antri]|uniref:LPXTG cell wall anchor domain-containing protein n=1 Tax=Nocardioides antri TaxID=2607659 RepID=A0A5B1M4S7_9ACTN|nr:LPXTG cell wall anchor domain-containing protein [Nocardioides antri]KAA1427139.1 LPXTG cell wall anchor domain-containing protein [Nocardioides antri]